MYNPQIREDLIPRIYQAAKSEGIPMTTWVSQVLEQALLLRGQPEPKESTRKEQN